MNISSKYLTHQVISNIGAIDVHLAEDVAAVLEILLLSRVTRRLSFQ